MGEEISTTRQPCGHNSFCNTCAMIIFSRAIKDLAPQCSLCRVAITEYIDTPVTSANATIGGGGPSGTSPADVAQVGTRSRVANAIPSDVLATVRRFNASSDSPGQNRLTRLLRGLWESRQPLHHYLSYSADFVWDQHEDGEPCIHPDSATKMFCVVKSG